MTRFVFDTQVIYWRGPAPFFFAPIPPDHAAQIRQLAKRVTYGWGMIPAEAAIFDVVFRTALFPKDEAYLLPLKNAVRQKTGVTAGDLVSVEITVGSA